MVEQELHDLEGAGLGAVVQRRVALHRLPVHVGTDLDEVLGDPEVALVARDHQAGVAVPVRDFNVWKTRRTSGGERFRGLQRYSYCWREKCEVGLFQFSLLLTVLS